MLSVQFKDNYSLTTHTVLCNLSNLLRNLKDLIIMTLALEGTSDNSYKQKKRNKRKLDSKKPPTNVEIKK